MSFLRLLSGILHPPFVYSANYVRRIFFRSLECKFASLKYRTRFEVYNFEPASIAKHHQGNFPLIIPLQLLRSEERMAKLAKAVGRQKTLGSGNEEGIVSSSSGFLSGDEDTVISAKSKGRGRKAKKEPVKEDAAPPQNAENFVKAAGTGRGHKKLSNEEEIPNAINCLDAEVIVQKTQAAGTKGHGKKTATEDLSQAVGNINVETVEVVAPAKRGRKTASTKIVETYVENNIAAATDVVPAPKGRGKGNKITAVPAIENMEPTAIQSIAEESSNKPKRQKTSVNNIARNEGAETVKKIVKDSKKKKITMSTKVKAEPIEPTNEMEPEAIDVKKTKPRSGRGQPKQQKEDIESPDEPEPIVEKAKSRSRQPKQEQKMEAVKDLLEKSTEKPLKGKAATKRKATNKDPVTDILVEKNLDELKVEAEEEDAEPTANKISKKEQTVKKPAKETKPRARAAKTQEKSGEKELENGVTEEDKKPKSRKRTATVVYADDTDGAKPTKAKKAKAPLMNATTTKYNEEDFVLPPNEDGVDRFNLKISSWNVAGLRSWLNKDGLRFLDYESPDIFCLQEIKCTIDQLPEAVARIPGYHPYWLCMPGGYAGVAIYSKIMPINVVYGIDNEEFDGVGRMITAEYEKFYLINVYVPNSGRKLVNLEARMRWEKLFQEYVKRLDAVKAVVICGDMNVSHQAIDLANPKSNTRSAGFTQEERDKMTELLALGFVDTFRHLYPERIGAYTYWTYMANARSRNVGWRLDYYIVSERFTKRVVDNCIRSQVMGSDHCPITLFLKI